MRKLIPLTAIAGAFVALGAIGAAQAAPAMNGLGASIIGTQPAAVEKVGWRRDYRSYRRHHSHRKWWWSSRRHKHHRRWN